MEDSKENESSNKMLEVLDWAYEKAINGLPGFGSAIDLANDYNNSENSIEENVNSLIRWQNTKTATTGFLTGLGGLITLPITLPADITCVIYVQIRMIAAIAHLGGYDIKNDKVKSLIYLCLVGDSAKDILKEVGQQIGIQIGQNLVKSIPGKFLFKINKLVGFRLLTKLGTKGAINLIKLVPILGGIISGSINALATNSIGNIARQTFIKTKTKEPIADNFTEYTDIEPTIDTELLKFYSYLNVIKIDGEKRNEEFNLLNSLVDNSLLDDKLKNEIKQKLSAKEFDKIDYSVFKNQPECSIELLSNLILISKCDNEFHIKELLFIKDIAKQLEISESNLDSLIDSIKSNN